MCRLSCYQDGVLVYPPDENLVILEIITFAGAALPRLGVD